MKCTCQFLFIFDLPGIKDICIMQKYFPPQDAWPETKAALYKWFAVISTCLLLAIILRNPMLEDDHHENLKDILPSHTNIIRQIPATRLDIPESGKAYNFIKNTYLNDPVRPGLINPVHDMMLKLNCYGNYYDLESDVKPYMQTTDDKPAFFFNLMLHAMDNTKTLNVSRQEFTPSTYDKSTCSCLRDFAGPSLLQVTTEESTCKVNDKTYKYDTCSMQKLLDYAIDSSGNVSTGTTIERKQIIQPTKTSPSPRNSIDVIKDQIENYETSLKTISNYLDNLAVISSDTKIVALLDFLQKYCKHAAGTAKKCPAEWINIDGTFYMGLKVRIAVDAMKTWPAQMHTYNKLSKTSGLTGMSSDTYMEKYKVAFETCTTNGVQSYSTVITGRTQAVHWYVLGELFLLLSSALSFFWAHVVKEKATEEDDSMAPKHSTVIDVLNWIYRVLSMLLPFVLIIIILVYYGYFQWGALEENNTISSEYGYFLTGFASVWLLLTLIIILLFIIVFVKTVGTPIFSFMLCCCQCLKKTPNATGKQENETSTSKKGTYALIEQEMKSNYHELHLHIFWAQIALDLPVIVGLTMLAVATTLQRGVADYNLILSVIILCTTTGLTTHITNVLRLIDMRTKADFMKQTGTPTSDRSKVNDIRYNRVIIGLIIALMLYVFINLAGLDSVQGSEFSVLHQSWFALIAFVILVCGDLSLEFFAVFYHQFNSEKHFLYKSIQQKSSSTGWLIIFGLLLLELHQRYWLCPRYELLDPSNFNRPQELNNKPLLCSWW